MRRYEDISSLPQKRNNGLHVKGHGKKLDIIVQDITFQGKNLDEVYLRIIGLEGFNFVHLYNNTHAQMKQQLAEGLAIEIRNMGGNIQICCEYDKKYHINHRKYYTV